MTDPIVIVGEDGGAYVPMADYERQRDLKRLYQRTLLEIAAALTRLADDAEALRPDDTDHAPL
jgi:hypothetical protein